MDIRQLRHFVSVSKERSFTDAAEKLGITQPALSESVRELEAELGVTLLLRGGRHRLSLTWPGATLYDEAQRILRLTEDASALTRAAATVDRQTLRLGVFEHGEPGVASKALARCRIVLPEMKLLIHVLPTGHQLRALRDGQIDLGIVIGPVGAADLIAELLWQEPLRAALLGDHPLSQNSAITVAELCGLPLILPPADLSAGYCATVLALFRAAGITPRTDECLLHWDTGLGLVAAGAGVVLIPAALDITRFPNIVAVSIDDKDATVPIMAAWRSADPANASILACVAALKSSRIPSG